MSRNLDAAERYQLAIYDVPFDARSAHNYAVWQGFKLCRILVLELEAERDKAIAQRDELMENFKQVVKRNEDLESELRIADKLYHDTLVERNDALEQITELEWQMSRLA